MNLKKQLTAICLSLCAAMAAIPSTANGAAYVAGDLVLFFFQEGGTGTVYVNLGQAYTYRGSAAGSQDAPTVLNTFLIRYSTQSGAAVTNLGTTLTNAFGANWANMTNLYAGLAAVRSSSTSTTAAAVNGDPSRTIYISNTNIT
jgi:hypothetical protein